MKLIPPFPLLSFVVVSAFLCLVPPSALAADSVTIEHNSPGKIGQWVLYYPGGILKSDDINVKKDKQTVYPSPGALTLSVLPPAGATLTIFVYKDDELVKKQVIQQISVTSEAGHSYRFYVQYAFTKQGAIGITSKPNGVLVRLQGPDGRRLFGKTPKTFERIYAGRYTVYANAAPGCVAPRPYTKQLKAGEKLVIHLELPCDLDKRKLAESKPLISRRGLKQGIDAETQDRATRRKQAQDLMRKAPVGSGAVITP